MNAIKRNVPNLITLGNLTCGLLSIVLSFEGKLEVAAAFIFFGAILDFFDGFASRLLKVSSEIGKQLDSMADLITFGLAPGFIIYKLILLQPCFIIGWSYDDYVLLSYTSFLIPIFSAIRLAKFNIDSKQTSSFVGLPTPASAIFIASLPILSYFYGTEFKLELLLGVTIILSLFLVAELPLFSLKISKGENLKSQLNIIRIIFLISCVILLFVLEFAAIPFIVILYIFLSIINNLIK
ncbi:MAG: CDP-diacylglycerol--serine O-phosphatidyltransferase [Flavobacteriales bacterium]|nr:CDP-diacylglycerol--serine O-phosphatidyltransferase [Flavobacteriales bacterium]